MTFPRLTPVAATVAVALTLVLSGCTRTSESEDPMFQSDNAGNDGAMSTSKPAPELLQRMLDLNEETTKVHGGNWTFSGPDRLPWERDTTGYFGRVCPGSEPLSHRYTGMIMGPAVDDPEAAVSKYVSHFEKQGFTEVGRYNEDVPSDTGSGYYIIVTLEDAEGNALIYQAGNHLSSLSYEGPCSEDPAMTIPTT
ncbi:hypothetical protein LJ754_11750 [Arthrobacter sp. zg-Y40]|uniref:hypothetical protein n=1 Tax=Arthrobacter sp. zg-Y40 TaxID=2886939 RepID=UPI001D137E44|nr:hypothetical protein [Arthrobacter sp. zg-Y40]MCC3279822.1 hypothetical protein [Arthrobacter sp. zg-Y40]